MRKPYFYTNLLNGDTTSEPVITESDFNEWFDDLLKNSVRVYGSSHHLDEGVFALGKTLGEEDTHTALLVDIQPIKKETAEDVLREMLKKGQILPTDKGLFYRAKAALGELDE